MSPEGAFRSDLLAWLRADDLLSDAVNAVLDSGPLRASEPYLTIDSSLAADWSVKDRAGREVRPLLSILDTGPSPDRAAAIATLVEARLAAMPRNGTGYELVTLVFLRSRLSGGAKTRWQYQLEYRARLFAAA
mgnify:CR=1 FL=1